MRAINSVLRCSDHRVGIRCHSNGEDERLAEYCRSDERVSYGSFKDNRGSAENFYKLYQDTQAKFCMLLSDEDSVLPQQLLTF